MRQSNRREGRALAPAEQLKVLSRVWRNDRDGYVFLPWISGDSGSKAARRKNYHEGRAFEWPREREAILAHLQAHQADDLYFCPNLFNGKRRQEELVYAEMCLYADLDEVDPRSLSVDRRPTVAWESSPGRFQGVWLLSGMREGATWAGRENQRLTYEIGADLSGWDSTQLLRVPGKPNYKHEYRDANGGAPVPGRLLWDNGPRYGWDDFDDLPEVGVVGGDEYDLMDEELLGSIDRHETWTRARMRCSPSVRRYMATRSEAEVEDADRSGVLWQIERDLADAGCTLAEIVAVVRPSVWNKFRGRNDELRQLKTEAAKAIGESRGDGALEVVDAKPKAHTTIDDLFAEDVPRPRWLIKDVWPEGGCGFIAGAPKSYKTWLAMDMAISLSTGTPFLCDPRFSVAAPRRVLYLQQEDSKSLVRDRFEVVVDGKSPRHNRGGLLRWSPGGGVEWEPPLAMPLFMEVRTGFVASDEGWQSWLDEYVGDEKIGMVVIDTLFTSAGNLDIDKSLELMTKMLKPLRVISDKHSCAVVMVHHNKKDAGGGGKVGDGAEDPTSSLGARAGRDMIGSQALHAWVDNALYVRARRSLDRLPGLTVEVTGDDGETRFLGVPGVEIYVERESKMAEERRFKVGIPKMVRSTGDRPDEGELAAADRWMPQVQEGWRWEAEGDGETPARGSRGATRNGRKNGSGSEGEGSRRAAGELIVERMREMGITASRGKTIEEICDVLDQEKRGVSKQLSAAVTAGWVRKSGDRWFVDAGADGEG